VFIVCDVGFERFLRCTSSVVASTPYECVGGSAIVDKAVEPSVVRNWK
jgi:hypothetical protein